MLELGAGADILRGLGWLYIGLMAVLVIAALWLLKRWWQKLLGVVVVLLVFTGPAYLRNRERGQLVDERKARYEAAKALFDERCKTAGEKVYRTVDGVDGVLLTNVRLRGRPASALDDPNWPDAALPNEPGEDGYIMTFLLWEQYQDKRNDRGYLNNSPSDRPGFSFVDVREASGSIFRYGLELPRAREMTREPLKGRPARYAVSFINMTDPQDRKLWLAGTKVLITDTLTQEVIAEKTWYAMEPGQGNTYGGRSPWAFAQQCPTHRGWSGASTRFFVDQVLKPKGEQ